MAPNTKQPLVSASSLKAIEDVKAFLSENVSKVDINSDEEAQGASTLGNELQKKYREIEALRVKEKKPHDDAGKQVQEYFQPVLLLIKSKQTFLSDAIGRFNVEKRRIQEEAVKQAQIAFEKEMDILESQIENAKEKAEKLLERAALLRSEALSLPPSDVTKRNGLLRQAQDAEFRAKKWESKAEAKVEQKAYVVPQPVVVAAPKVEGTRATKEIVVDITDVKAFLRWVSEGNDLYLVEVREPKLKAYIKDHAGVTIPGVSYSEKEKVGFSGR